MVVVTLGQRYTLNPKRVSVCGPNKHITVKFGILVYPSVSGNLLWTGQTFISLQTRSAEMRTDKSPLCFTLGILRGSDKRPLSKLTVVGVSVSE